ncbi:MAG: hypothetical protein L0Z50_40565 [Verrucomicrobiales bacterium]|nr:hypothetical protein [Verrucomicrobiales bacterium]
MNPGVHYVFVGEESNWQAPIADFYARQYLKTHFDPVFLRNLAPGSGYSYPDDPRFKQAAGIIAGERSVVVTSLVRPPWQHVDSYKVWGAIVIEVIAERRSLVRLSCGGKTWKMVPVDGSFIDWIPAQEEVSS